MSIDWICKHHSDLSKEQLYTVLQLRTAVFVVEQKCAYQEVDGQDLTGDTNHLMAWQEDRLVAYLRLLDPDSQGGDVVIGRGLVVEEARGRGLGHELIARGLEEAEKNWPRQPVYLSAQEHLQAYYEGYGFSAVGEPYLEDGIAHIGMRKG